MENFVNQWVEETFYQMKMRAAAQSLKKACEEIERNNQVLKLLGYRN